MRCCRAARRRRHPSRISARAGENVGAPLVASRSRQVHNGPQPPRTQKTQTVGVDLDGMARYGIHCSTLFTEF